MHYKMFYKIINHPKNGERLIYRPDLAGNWNEVYLKVVYEKYDLEFTVLQSRLEEDGNHKFVVCESGKSTGFVVSEKDLYSMFISKDDYIKHKLIEKLNNLIGDNGNNSKK